MIHTTLGIFMCFFMEVYHGKKTKDLSYSYAHALHFKVIIIAFMRHDAMTEYACNKLETYHVESEHGAINAEARSIFNSYIKYTT